MKTKANTLLLESYLKTLRLPTMLAEYLGVVRQGAEKDAAYDSFLEHLAELEVNARATKATERRLKQARFPVAKELAEIDFSAVPKLNKSKMLEMARGDFIDERSNLVFLGAPGSGKTHVATALGIEACERGKKVRFWRVTELLTSLMEAREDRQLMRMKGQLAKLDLLILDELGYVPASKLGAELLFDVISTAYERTSVILTTTPPFEQGTEVLGSERLTGAFLDRLTHRCHILEATGESYRLRDARRRKSSPKRSQPKRLQ